MQAGTKTFADRFERPVHCKSSRCQSWQEAPSFELADDGSAGLFLPVPDAFEKLF